MLSYRARISLTDSYTPPLVASLEPGGRYRLFYYLLLHWNNVQMINKQRPKDKLDSKATTPSLIGKFSGWKKKLKEVGRSAVTEMRDDYSKSFESTPSLPSPIGVLESLLPAMAVRTVRTAEHKKIHTLTKGEPLDDLGMAPPMLHESQIDVTIIRDSFGELIVPGGILAESRLLKASLSRAKKFAARLALQWFYLYRKWIFTAKPGNKLTNEEISHVTEQLKANAPSDYLIVVHFDALETPLASYPDWYTGCIVGYNADKGRVKVAFKHPDIPPRKVSIGDVHSIDPAWLAGRRAAPSTVPCMCSECSAARR